MAPPRSADAALVANAGLEPLTARLPEFDSDRRFDIGVCGQMISC